MSTAAAEQLAAVGRAAIRAAGELSTLSRFNPLHMLPWITPGFESAAREAMAAELDEVRRQAEGDQ